MPRNQWSWAISDDSAVTLSEGDIITSATGRALTPGPRVDLSSDRKAQMSIRRFNSWLTSNAKDEAKALGMPHWVLACADPEQPSKLTSSELQEAHDILFSREWLQATA